MSPELLIEMATEAFNKREVGMVKRWRLVWPHGGMRLVPAKGQDGIGYTVATLAESTIASGLTADEWNRLGFKLFDFWKVRYA